MPDQNPLGLYQPYTKEQTKALTSLPQPRGAWGSTPVYSSWSAWDSAHSSGFAGTNLNYSQLVGDLWQSSLVMSGVRWLGNVLPSAPLMVKESTGKKGESDEIPNHELVRLWRRPNKFYSGSTLLKGFAFSWILSGNACFIKVWNKAGTKPTELWYEPHWSIRPRWVGDQKGAFIPGPEGDDPNALIAYYELDREWGKMRVETSDVIHFRDGFDPANRRLGLSRVGAILREIYGDGEAANYAARLAGGSGVPSFVLSIDKDLDVKPDDIRGIQAELVRKTTGDQKGQPMVVTGGKVEKMGVDPDKMDLRSSHRFSEERFSAVTGIPAVALELGAGHEHSIYNNVKAADERAWEAYLLPLYTHMEDELNVQLLEDFEGESSRRYCRFDISGVRALQEDEDAKHKRVVGDYQGGVISKGEARSALGYEVKPGQEDEYSGQSAPAQLPEPPAKSIKSVPSDDEVDKTGYLHFGVDGRKVHTDDTFRLKVETAAKKGDGMAKDKDYNAADSKFARDMIPHHEAAVEMARKVLKNGLNDEILDLAYSVVKTQTKEIETLRKWLKDRGEDEGGGSKM